MINNKSELAQRFWEKGKLKDCPILDFHAHMGDNGGIFMPKKTASLMADTMKKCNTLITLFCGHEALFQPSIGEKYDIKAHNDFPDKFRLYHGVVSRYLDPEKDIERIENNPEMFVGFKFLCDYYSVPLSDPSHDPYWEYADRNRLIVLSHTWGGSKYNGKEEIEKVLDKYKNIVFVAGHSLNGHWKDAIELSKKYPNLYLEMTAVLDDRGALDLFIDKIGSQKILFGTDLPWFSTLHGIGAVLSAKMTDEDRRNIFYANGVKILKRFPWFEPLYGDYLKSQNIF